MLQTPHVVVGTAIAIKVGNPALALPLALASHFVLDRVPHWNPHTYTEAVKYGHPKKSTILLTIIDIGTAFALGLWIASQFLPDYRMSFLILLSAFASVVPDIAKYPFFLFKSLRRGLYKKYVEWERSIQTDVSFYPGVFTQLAIIVVGIWWMFS